MNLVEDKRGAVMVEFLIIFLTFLVIVLCMVQHALLRQGHLAVQRAASAAARSAAVVLDDDPERYGGESRMQLGSADGTSAIDGWMTWAGQSGMTGSASQSRMATIRAAALYPLLAVSVPTGGTVTNKSVAEAIGDGSASPASAAALYARAALAVVVQGSGGGSSGSFSDGEVVTVRVSYAFHCGVPLARWVMCRTVSDVASSPAAADFSKTELPWVSTLSGIGGRFRHLRAEHTTPIHSASYSY